MADATYAVGESSDTAVLSKVFSEVYHLRARESRELSSSGFVVVNSTSNFWMDVFIRYFLCNESPDHHDDLVFFVKKATRKSTARYFPRVETSVQVFRRASKKLPIADLEMHWEETVYLNLIMQQLEYTLTGAVCTRTSSQHLQVLRRKSQRVYASPSRHSMEDKGELEEMAYPDIFFAVDNYEEAFQGLTLRPGEMLCVELAARDRECGRLQGLLFLGCVRQEALGNAHRARGPPGPNGCHYVGLRGPRGKGHAQVALRRGPAPAQEWPFPPWRRSSEPSTALLAPCSGTLQRCRSERQGIDVFSGDELEADDPRDALRDEPTIAPKGEGLLDALLTFVALPWHHIVAGEGLVSEDCEVPDGSICWTYGANHCSPFKNHGGRRHTTTTASFPRQLKKQHGSTAPEFSEARRRLERVSVPSASSQAEFCRWRQLLGYRGATVDGLTRDWV